jgi:hypothetical protein
MKRALLAAATVALLATSAQAATPKTTLSRSGVWETFITTNDKGVTICGMQVNGRDSSLMVKYTGEQIFVQIFKAGWNIPNGTRISGSFTYDRERFPANGTGYVSNVGHSYVEFMIKAGGEAEFIRQFTEANTMVVGFDQGTQRPFIVDMTGEAKPSWLTEIQKQPRMAEPKPEGAVDWGDTAKIVTAAAAATKAAAEQSRAYTPPPGWKPMTAAPAAATPPSPLAGFTGFEGLTSAINTLPGAASTFESAFSTGTANLSSAGSNLVTAGQSAADIISSGASSAGAAYGSAAAAQISAAVANVSITVKNSGGGADTGSIKKAE